MVVHSLSFAQTRTEESTGASGSTCTSSQHASLAFLFAQRVINSPTGGVAGAVLFFFLNLNPHQGRTFKQHMREFDFLGLFLVIAGVICLLFGFNFSETSCESQPLVFLNIAA